MTQVLMYFGPPIFSYFSDLSTIVIDEEADLSSMMGAFWGNLKGFLAIDIAIGHETLGIVRVGCGGTGRPSMEIL